MNCSMKVDFDGTYLAARLMKFYNHEFIKIRDSMEDELQGKNLSWIAISLCFGLNLHSHAFDLSTIFLQFY